MKNQRLLPTYDGRLVPDRKARQLDTLLQTAERDPQDTLTLTELLRDVGVTIENKMTNAVEFYQQKRVVDDTVQIAGIDITQGGRNLTAKQHKKFEKNVTKLHTEWLRLGSTFANHNPIIIPQNIFDLVRERLGLLAIVPNEGNTGAYTISLEWSQKRTQLEHEKDNDNGWYFIGTALFTCTIIGLIAYTIYAVRSLLPPVMQEIALAVQFDSYSGAAIVIISVIVSFIFAYKISRQKSMQKIGKLRKNYVLMFPQLRLENGYKEGDRYTPYRGKDWVQVTIPQPPPEQFEEILAVAQAAKGKKGMKIITVADEKAIGITLHEAKREKPVSVTTSSDYDPGLAVEHGSLVAVLPNTFYFMTELEQRFIDEVRQAAENWDAKSYVYN